MLFFSIVIEENGKEKQEPKRDGEVKKREKKGKLSKRENQNNCDIQYLKRFIENKKIIWFFVNFSVLNENSNNDKTFNCFVVFL